MNSACEALLASQPIPNRLRRPTLAACYEPKVSKSERPQTATPYISDQTLWWVKFFWPIHFSDFPANQLIPFPFSSVPNLLHSLLKFRWSCRCGGWYQWHCPSSHEMDSQPKKKRWKSSKVTFSTQNQQHQHCHFNAGSRKCVTPTTPLEMSELHCKQTVFDEVHSSCFDHVSNSDRQGCNASHKFFNLNKNFEAELGRCN